MWRFLLIAVLPSLAIAGSVEDEAQGCMFQANPVDVRNCLSDVFYRRDFQMDERVASVTSRLGGTNGLQAEVLASKFESELTAWRVETDERCNHADVVSREICRLSALQSQEQNLSIQLDLTMREFGGN